MSHLKPADSSQVFTAVAGIFQAILLVLFLVGVDYDQVSNSTANVDKYQYFQDVNMMIFVGFGFLMTAVWRGAWSSLGLTFLIAVMSIQWGILTVGFFHAAVEGSVHKIHMSIETLIGGDFAAGAVLISFGAIVGRASPTQLVIMVFMELIFYAISEAIGLGSFVAIDVGGSIFVHAFGAFFGLAVSFALGNAKTMSKDSSKGKPDAPTTSKTAGMTAMLGTFVLWCFWPSFNGALANGAQQHRAIINTALSLCASCVATFIVSRLVRGGKFDMEDVQNATLAGGVAVGSSADLVIQPGSAILVGMIAGTVSTLGFAFLTGWLSNRFGLDDTLGILNLHGIPGLIGAFGGAISAGTASDMVYGESISTVFPARGTGRTAEGQAGFQLAALGVTLALAIVGGLLTGYVMSFSVFGQMGTGESRKLPGLFEDERVWVTEELDRRDPAEPYATLRDAEEGHGSAHDALASSSAVELVGTVHQRAKADPQDSAASA